MTTRHSFFTKSYYPDSFMNCHTDEIVFDSKPMQQTDFSAPQGRTGLVPVEMTDDVILSAVEGSVRQQLSEQHNGISFPLHELFRLYLIGYIH